MARTVHNLMSNETTSVAIVETAGSGGGKYSQPAVLSTVRMSNADLDQLFSRRVLNNPAIEVVERWDVDARNQGPHSKFGLTLEAMVDELDGHLPGGVLVASSKISDVRGLSQHMDELAKSFAFHSAEKLEKCTRKAAGSWSPDPKEVDAQFERRFAEASEQSEGLQPERHQARARMRL